ncbi:MAG: glycosyltransferase family 2 protein [Bacteroidia bacterium]|nr:glycosyltransferase family 2 protein [Bacteroidia bacterium]
MGSKSAFKIPIIINNFNRLTFPMQLIAFLERAGYTNLIILDNRSTYPPLLEYYNQCPHQVIRLDQNYGHLALWKSGLYTKFKWSYFAYTDSDILPGAECPPDFMLKLKNMLLSHFNVDKVGFAIRIDNLPGFFALHEKVKAYEARYWNNEVSPNVYKAPIDTTFALYKPHTALVAGEIYTVPALRLAGCYTANHLPWYNDTANPTAEEKFYMDTCNASSSMGMQQKGTRMTY